MLRYIRSLRSRPNVFSLGARVYQTNYAGPEHLVVQRVKVTNKRSTIKRLMGRALFWYICYEVYTTLILDELVDRLSEQESEMTPAERKEMHEEVENMEPLFIPLPGTTRAVEQPPYKINDPEWRLFGAISRDPKLLGKIATLMASETKEAIERSDFLAHKYGPGSCKNITITKTWLDIDIPQRPPPVLERKGISWDDEGIFLVTKPVDPYTSHRIQKILWPAPVASAFGSFYYELLKQNTRSVARFMGWKPSDEDISSKNTPVTLDKIRQQIDRPMGKPVGKPLQKPASDGTNVKSEPAAAEPSARSSMPPSTKESATEAPSSGEKTTSDARSSGPLSKTQAADSDKDNQRVLKDIYPVSSNIIDHTKGPWQKFKAKMAQRWRPTPTFPPPGCILVKTRGQYANNNVIIVIETSSYFNPKNFSLTPLRMALISHKPKQIKPLG